MFFVIFFWRPGRFKCWDLMFIILICLCCVFLGLLCLGFEFQERSLCSCLPVFPCACAALRLICRFASASFPSRPAALGSIFVRAILVLEGALPNGPLGKGWSRPCSPETTRNNSNWQVIDMSPAPLHCILNGGRPLNVCLPLRRCPCVGNYCTCDRKRVLFCRQMFE
jgi:hypothetical protein